MDGKLIGLHHHGAIDDGVNSAARMSFTCADAGNLLIVMALKISDSNSNAFEFMEIYQITKHS